MLDAGVPDVRNASVRLKTQKLFKIDLLALDAEFVGPSKPVAAPRCLGGGFLYARLRCIEAALERQPHANRRTMKMPHWSGLRWGALCGDVTPTQEEAMAKEAKKAKKARKKK